MDCLVIKEFVSTVNRMYWFYTYYYNKYNRWQSIATFLLNTVCLCWTCRCKRINRSSVMGFCRCHFFLKLSLLQCLILQLCSERDCASFEKCSLMFYIDCDLWRRFSMTVNRTLSYRRVDVQLAPSPRL